jgi:quercetin dioxygenase-like cupin family protein
MTKPPNAISGDVQPAEDPAASADVRRREFPKGTAALYLAALGSAAHALLPGADANKMIRSKENTLEINKASSQASAKGPADWFTGTVRIDPLFTAPDPALVAGASVTFEPGARTAWHTHPLGQTLIVTSGAGWAQREGGPIEEIHPGDVIWFAPGEKHWHGAAPTTAMTHIAIQERKDGKMVDWMEHVSDEQYRKA